jgi:hypothetical protein
VANNITITNTYAAGEGMTLYNKKLLFDDEYGNELGWNPDGKETTFTIEDPSVDKWNSIIIVNLRTAAPNVCNVDFIFTGDFDITCMNPPNDRSRLHYMLINSEPIDESGLALSNVMENQTDVPERERPPK